MERTLKDILKEEKPYRVNTETCAGLAKSLISEIEELLAAGYSLKQINSALSNKAGKPLKLKTFYTAMNRIKKVNGKANSGNGKIMAGNPKIHGHRPDNNISSIRDRYSKPK